MDRKCRCKIISFDHINLYLLIIPLGALFKAAKDLVQINSDKLGETKIKGQHPIIATINYALGLCLSFIFFIIYIIYNKKHETGNLLIFENVMNKLAPNKTIKKIEKFLWILLGSIIDFFANAINSYNWLKDSDEFLTYSWSNILFLCLFSFLLLKIKLYRHHYLTAGIIIIIELADNFISIKFDKIDKNIKGHIIYLLAEGTFNSLYVFYKFIMINKFIKSYVILFFQGLIELILGVISLVITTAFIKEVDDFFLYWEGLDKIEILFFFGLMLVNFVTYSAIYIIIDIFTPFHIFLLYIIADLIVFFIQGGFKDIKLLLIPYMFFFVICIFMILVFIEIIQLNFCGLSNMTKKNIEERATIDSSINVDIDNNNDNDEEEGKEENKEDIEDNDKDKFEQIISMKGYLIELKDLCTIKVFFYIYNVIIN